MSDVKTPQEIWGGEIQGQCQAQSLQGLQSQASGLAQQAAMGQSLGEISEEALANGAGSELSLVDVVSVHGGGDLYEARIIGFYQYADRCHHADLRARNGGGVECPSCGIFVSDLALKRIGTPRYDEARMKLADECGRLRSENDALLRENRTLRLRAEAAERRRR